MWNFLDKQNVEYIIIQNETVSYTVIKVIVPMKWVR